MPFCCRRMMPEIMPRGSIKLCCETPVINEWGFPYIRFGLVCQKNRSIIK